MDKRELILALTEKTEELEQLSVSGGYGGTNMPLIWQKSGIKIALELINQLDDRDCEIDYMQNYEKDCICEIIGRCKNCGTGILDFKGKPQSTNLHKHKPYCKFCPNCGCRIKSDE